MAILNVVTDPSLETPNMPFNTGAVVNGVGVMYPSPPGIGSVISTWSVLEWGQSNYLNPTDYSVNNSTYVDPLYGNPRYTWVNNNNSVSVNVYQNTSNGYVYDLTQSGVTNGNNLFLSSNPNPNYLYTFNNPITFSLDAKISEAYYDNTIGTAGLVQLFTGFIAIFNASGNPHYDSNLPTISAFFQIKLTSPDGSDARYISQNGNQIISTYTLPGDPALNFSSNTAGQPQHLTYNVNSYLEDMIAHTSGLPTQIQDLSLWNFANMYIGSEMGSTNSGVSHSNSSVSLQVSNVSVTDNTSQTVSYNVPSQDQIPAFDSQGSSNFSQSRSTFSTLFEDGSNVGAGSVTYDGSGSVLSPLYSLNKTLLITGGTSTMMPDGYQGVYDFSTHDTLSFSNTSSGSTNVFLSGDTTVTSGSNDTTIYANGNDSIYADAGNVSVYGGIGSLMFHGGSGTANVYAGGSGSVLQAGSGTTNLHASSGSSSSEMIGGSGTTVEWGAGSGAVSFIAGSNGYTVMVGQDGTGPETFFTAKNTTVIAALDGNSDTVIGGTGSSQIIGGSGIDTFGFINGYAGGSETIYNFSAQDHLVFGGYTSWPIYSESVVNGSDVMTLIDNTRITLLGIDHHVF